VDHLQEPLARKTMTKWVREYVLEEDEDEIYYKLLEEVSVWTEREDIVYEK